MKIYAFCISTILIISIAGFNWQSDFQQKKTDAPSLFKKITVPKKLRVQNDSLDYGGDIRIGDLTNNGQVDFIVYRGAEGDKNGATKPCFIGAFDMDGNILWQKGEGGIQPYRPGPIAIHGINSFLSIPKIHIKRNNSANTKPHKGSIMCV